ncbi:MAG: MFS transporter [Rhodospirillaceae bacterium]
MNAESDAAIIDGAPAWRRMMLALTLSTIGGIGFWSVVVALPAIQAEFHIDRGSASTPYLATFLAFAVGGILMGRLSDKFGVFVPVILGGAMLGVGYVAAAVATELWQFIAAQALFIGCLGSSATFAPLVADVSLWFRRRRGIAVAIVASGNYLSGTLWPPLIQCGIDTIGWRQTHVVIGIVCIATILPLALLLRRRAPIDPHDGQAAPGAKLSNGPTGIPRPPGVQVLLMIAGIACCIAMATPQVHIVAYCGDLGYGTQRGAEMLSVMLGLGVVSRISFGLIADKIGGLGALLVSSALQMLAMFFYLPFDGLASLYIVSAMFGLAQGGIVPSYALIARDYFSASQAATRISLVLMSTVAGMAIGGWMAGEIYDFTGSYSAAFVNGIGWNALNVTIALLLLWHRRRPRPQLAMG